MSRARILLIFAIGCVLGCGVNASLPKIDPVVAIKVNVHKIVDLGIREELIIQVPKAEIASFSKMVLPIRRCSEVIDPKRNYHVADIYLEHPSGKTTQLYVRWTGVNPAAVSLDDRTYYFSDDSAYPDGAIGIIRKLADYEHAEQPQSPNDSKAQ